MGVRKVRGKTDVYQFLATTSHLFQALLRVEIALLINKISLCLLTAFHSKQTNHMRKYYPFSFVSIFIMLANFSYAQQFQWARQISGIDHDQGSALVVDPSGNVYTVGVFWGTVDFDPGPSVLNITAAGGYDIFLSKLDQNGNFVWAKTMGEAGDDFGYAIDIDDQSNIYITGGFHGTIDFDPNAGVTNVASAGDEDIFVCKYTSAGNLVWAKQMGGGDMDEGHSIAVDNDYNVYTTGYFNIMGDFDPGAGSCILSGQSCTNLFVSKLSGVGNFIWGKNVDGPSDGYSLKVDSIGNIFVTGIFAGTRDFDPNAGISYLASAGDYDAFVFKYDLNGNLVWCKSYGGTGLDNANYIRLDASDNIFITGYFINTVDFDPNAGVSNMTAGNYDAYVLRLNAAGNFGWAKQITGLNAERGYSLDLDSLGNIYITGDFIGTADFDPGVATFTISSTWSANSIFVCKLDYAGNFAWAVQLGGNGIGQDIHVDRYGNIYTTGFFYYGTGDFDPGSGVYNLTATGGNDVLIHKMSQSVLGVNENKISSGILVYPNPATDFLQIQSDVNWSQYKVVNSLGQIVLEGSCSSHIPINNLDAGIYFIQLFDNEGKITQTRFIKSAN
jgi:hypothetical protein